MLRLVRAASGVLLMMESKSVRVKRKVAPRAHRNVTPQVDDCAVDLVWKPAWDPMVHASEEVRMALGIW